MAQRGIYLDGHATTPVDPRVADVVLRLMTRDYGNAASIQHEFGSAAQREVEHARAVLAEWIGARPREIVFTSGATESTNLAIRGLIERADPTRKRIVAVATEHQAVLDPLARAARLGFDVELVPVTPADRPDAGIVDRATLESAVTSDTLLVCVMLANNEIGVIQPLAEIASLCHERGALLLCDAAQALGRITIDLDALGIDLATFSAHKLYGPQGVGALYVRRGVKLAAQLDGGGHERGLRSGTLNVPGIAGFGKAIELCQAEMSKESARLQALRDRLFAGLQENLDGVLLNGPALDRPDLRLPHNLNCSFAGVDGDALLAAVRPLAVSSGSACTTHDPRPSHVISALGRDVELTRGSLRFGLGRFNTPAEIEQAIEIITAAVKRLRAMP